MAQETSKLVEALSKLVELTQEGKIEWTASSEHYSTPQDWLVVAAFKGQWEGWKLRITKFNRKIEPEALSLTSISIALGRPTKPYWKTQYKLDIVDDRGMELYSFPTSSVVSDLFETIQYQAAGVSGFMDKLLDSE